LSFALGLYWSVAGAQQGVSPDKPQHTILVLGDSLSAEYGLKRGSGWVGIVQRRLDDAGLDYAMRNASISGDTTSGGLSRLPAALQRHAPDIVIVELGSNDALRGLSLQMTRDNLARIIELSQQAGARVLLVGMQIPPNYGRPYTEQFRQLFEQLANERRTAFVPFLLDGMAQDRSLFQDDGMHPNEQAQEILANNVWTGLRPMVAMPR